MFKFYLKKIKFSMSFPEKNVCVCDKIRFSGLKTKPSLPAVKLKR